MIDPEVVRDRELLQEAGFACCYDVNCGEKATRVCDCCDQWACSEHSAHFETSSCGETTQCDVCLDEARTEL
jgi:hypothetical protein